jgi:hypothetical protein
LPKTYSNFSHVLGDSGIEALKTFVSNGGVLVGFDTALETLTSENIDLLSTSLETAATEGENNKEDKGANKENTPVPVQSSKQKTIIKQP